MQPGQVAMWLTLGSGLMVALIAAYAQRFGPQLTRRTEIDKMYLDRLKAEEAKSAALQHECDDLRDRLEQQRTRCDEEADDLRKQIHDLREQIIMLKGAREELEEAQATLLAQKRLLKLWNPNREDEDDIIT